MRFFSFNSIKPLFNAGLILIATGVTREVQAQNSSAFHHLLNQETLNEAGFRLVLVSKDTARNLTLPVGKDVKAVVTLDKGIIFVDVWRIHTHESDPRIREGYDEFGTALARKSNTLNAYTPIFSPVVVGNIKPLTTYTLQITDDRYRIGAATRVLTLPFRAWTWGVNTSPFRYRFGRDGAPDAVTSTLNFNVSYGITWGHTIFTSRLMRHIGNTVALFAGVGSAELKQSTVINQQAWKTRLNAFEVSDRTNPTVSYGLSYTYSLNNFGVSISGGLESAIGPESSQWAYQHQPWIGLGVATSLGFFK